MRIIYMSRDGDLPDNLFRIIQKYDVSAPKPIKLNENGIYALDPIDINGSVDDILNLESKIILLKGVCSISHTEITQQSNSPINHSFFLL